MSVVSKPNDARTHGRTVALERFYLHGDEIEGEPGTYFCRRCDCFFGAEHFADCEMRGRIGDLALIDKDRAVLMGKSVPAWIALAADPMRAAREIRRNRRARYYRPENPRTIWNRNQ